MTEQLVERLKAHKGTIAKLLSISGAPGLSLGVIHHGQVIHTAHMGRRAISSPEPPNNNSVYFVAFMFKIVIACTVGRLVSSGHLTWDIPIHEYLPELKRRDTLGLQATVQDLLANRTGLPMARFYWGQ
jgi:CubicO group peptidase (beta-lactamase class C family)